MTTLPEIREADATDAIAALYADMRRVMRVPMINLVYRHIATIPNGLSWTWSGLRPHVVSGEIAALANHVLAIASKQPWDRPSPVTALPETERLAISAIIDWYNRGNAINLVALLSLRAAPFRITQGDCRGVVSGTKEIPPTPLQPALSPESLDPHLRRSLADVCARQGLGERGITPTMYLHLAHWPGPLADILADVDQAIDSGTLAHRASAIIAAAESPACRLSAPLVPSGPAPDASGKALIDAAREMFTRKAIPQMIAIGTHLVE